MTPAFLMCAADVLQVEAGYQCDPKDRGNYTGAAVNVGVLVGTNRGISAPILARWRKTPVTAADMRALTREEALAIYEALFWAPLHGDELPLPIAYCCFDAEVMSGMGDAPHHRHRTVAWLQGALGIEVDDQLGPITISAASVCNVASVIADFGRRRLAFLQADPDWPHFGRGWQLRIDKVQALALIPPTSGEAGKEQHQ